MEDSLYVFRFSGRDFQPFPDIQNRKWDRFPTNVLLNI